MSTLSAAPTSGDVTDYRACDEEKSRPYVNERVNLSVFGDALKWLEPASLSSMRCLHSDSKKGGRKNCPDKITKCT